MKRIVLTLIASVITPTIFAQVEDDWAKRIKESRESVHKEYEEFRQQVLKDYDDFRRKANEDYAKFMEEAWSYFPAQPAEEIPWSPKPVSPVVFKPEYEQDSDPAPHPDPVIVPSKVPVPAEEPVVVPVPKPVPSEEPVVVPVPESIPSEEPVVVPVPEPIPVEEPVVVPVPKPAPVLTEEPVAIAPLVARRPESKPIAFDLKPAETKPLHSPQPAEPIKFTPRPNDVANSLYFFGTELRFHYDKSHALQLSDLSEKSVAGLWRQLSDPYYDNLVAECLQQREEKKLCDWAYIMLTQQVADTYCGGHTNESVVMHMYILTQSGFQMRLAKAGKRLVVLLGSMEKIYHYKYFVIDGVKYYNFDDSIDDCSVSIFNHAFPKESTLSLVMTQPRLMVEYTDERTIVSKRYPEAKVTVEMNKNLIDFFDSCPKSAQWTYYSSASISESLKNMLYPELRKAIAGKSQAEAANILLNFVQTGFDYATDQEQFGYERPLYPDETFFYPFCDCEDRSILFSCLMRELLGLDAVLLNYPGHLATAVCFTEDVAGNYLTFEGKKYVICDPTYIGAEIGRCMPDLVNVVPKIEKFN